MNQKILTNNNICKHVDVLSRGHANCIKINIGNKSEHHKKHEIKKALMAIDLLFDGKTIYTECKHEDIDRISDIYIADDNLVIEIANSESDKSLDAKEKAFGALGYNFQSIRI